MVASKQLYDAAKEIADELQQQCASLEAKLRKIELEAHDIKGKLHAANLTSQRLAGFRLTDSKGDPLCPRCWMWEGTDQVMPTVPADGADDLYRCRTCNFVLAVPI